MVDDVVCHGGSTDDHMTHAHGRRSVACSNTTPLRFGKGIYLVIHIQGEASIAVCVRYNHAGVLRCALHVEFSINIDANVIAHMKFDAGFNDYRNVGRYDEVAGNLIRRIGSGEYRMIGEGSA